MLSRQESTESRMLIAIKQSITDSYAQAPSKAVVLLKEVSIERDIFRQQTGANQLPAL